MSSFSDDHFKSAIYSPDFRETRPFTQPENGDDMSVQKSENERSSRTSLLERASRETKGLWERYDPTFMTFFTVASWNAGLKFMFFLSYQDMYKNVYGLEPTHTQFLTTIIFFPWVLKFFYGILSDGVAIFGSRKRNWLVLMGLIQFLSLSFAALARITNPNKMALLLMLMAFSGAFIDVVMDALMVIEAKKYPHRGSQDLLSWSWCVAGLAALVSGISAAFILEFANPYICY